MHITANESRVKQVQIGSIVYGFLLYRVWCDDGVIYSSWTGICHIMDFLALIIGWLLNES